MTSVAIQVSGISKRYQRGMTATKRPPQWIDYFVFRKGLFCGKIPEFVIGRPGCDNWLLWYARSSGARRIAASAVIRAIHQNHDYGYHPDGEKAVSEGEEAQENYKPLEGHRKFRTLEDATYVLTKGGLRRNYRHWLVQFKRAAYDTCRALGSVFSRSPGGASPTRASAEGTVNLTVVYSSLQFV